MWDNKLEWIAVLISIFSIFYPFFKLVSLSVIWFVKPKSPKFCENYLKVMSQMGRWSLLDIFVALIMIVLADGQGKKFKVDMHAGLPLFLIAIIISMCTTEIMLYL